MNPFPLPAFGKAGRGTPDTLDGGISVERAMGEDQIFHSLKFASTVIREAVLLDGRPIIYAELR